MKPAALRSAGRQRGAVLIFTLIILLIMTIGGVALVRSMNTSMFSAGNLAFRRDLMNQGEQAVYNVLKLFETGGPLVGNTTANQPNYNYSATILPTNAQGVPTALLNVTTFATVGTTANNIAGATPDVTIQYLIDRLCTAAGPASSDVCVQSSAAPTGASIVGTPQVAPPTATVYRLSAVVNGARSTQVFLQTTFTMPN